MKLRKEPIREIIEDFAQEIEQHKTKGPKPSTMVINFRNEKADKKERAVWSVPWEFLRFRKDNGRIASDVMSYERSVGPLLESEKLSQEKLVEFLDAKDPKKNDEIYKLIHANGQNKPAIITCDGFLIDGNRRRLTLAKLSKDYPQNPEFKRMNVVILPGFVESEPPPTLLEIDQIESRYQLQGDGKAEYYGFDAALSIREKIKRGFSLEDQLRYDPQFAALPLKEFTKELNEKKKKQMAPLAHLCQSSPVFSQKPANFQISRIL